MNKVKIINRRWANQRQPYYFFILMVVLHLSAGPIDAQLPKDLPTSKTGTVNAGSLVTQFMNAIKTSSFTDEWKNEKGNCLGSAGKIVTAPGMIESVTSLAKNIKPSMFKEAFQLDNLLKTASSAKSMADATELLKNLEGGLKPEPMVSDWGGKKNTWLSALNLVK
jgi:hypothetical protein